MGSLQWLSHCTRPDIDTATSILAKYQNSPLPGHLQSARHIVKYLKGTSSYGIVFHSSHDKLLQSFLQFPPTANVTSPASRMPTGGLKINQHRINPTRTSTSTNRVQYPVTSSHSTDQSIGPPNANQLLRGPLLNLKFTQLMNVAKTSCICRN